MSATALTIVERDEAYGTVLHAMRELNMLRYELEPGVTPVVGRLLLGQAIEKAVSPLVAMVSRQMNILEGKEEAP